MVVVYTRRVKTDLDLIYFPFFRVCKERTRHRAFAKCTQQSINYFLFYDPYYKYEHGKTRFDPLCVCMWGGGGVVPLK
jgi:hypothetical protein